MIKGMLLSWYEFWRQGIRITAICMSSSILVLWAGLCFPQIHRIEAFVIQWLSHVWLFSTQWTIRHTSFPIRHHLLELALIHVQWVTDANSPGKNTGVGSHFLLGGIFLTQGLNPSLLHCRWIPYHLSYLGSPALNLWQILLCSFYSFAIFVNNIWQELYMMWHFEIGYFNSA